MTLDVDALRGHITTDLGDEALGLLLDAAYEAIDAVIGAGGAEEYPTSVTEVITPGPGPLFMLSRPASVIASIEECDTALAADDYELITDQMVRRLSDGTNPASRWRGRCIVTYHVNDLASRDRVAIALINLDLDYTPGLQSERLGDHSITANVLRSYDAERDAILASLTSGFIAV